VTVAIPGLPRIGRIRHRCWLTTPSVVCIGVVRVAAGGRRGRRSAGLGSPDHLLAENAAVLAS